MERSTIAEAYIARLKAEAGVTSDDALAEVVGLGKSTLASWRRRGFVPLRARDELSAKFKLNYIEVVDDVFASWLERSIPGDTIISILAMRLAAKIPKAKIVDWSRWLADWRREVLSSVAVSAGRWNPDKESLSDRLSLVLMAVAEEEAKFGADYIIKLRRKIEGS